jgi:hypothetical protein
MSATLALKVAAPVFAFAVAGLIWAVAGPLAAGLSLVTFLLGVVTSELDHMRWKAVEDPASDAAADSALMALLEARAPAEPLPEPAPRPRHYYRATANELAIGSGRGRRSLEQRTRRERAAPPAPAPAVPDILQAIEEELFAPAPALPELPEPAPVLEAALRPEPAAAGGRPEFRAIRAEPPPPKVTVFRSAYAERAGRR